MKFYSLLNQPEFNPEHNCGNTKTEQEFISAKSLITSMQIPPGTFKNAFGLLSAQDLQSDALSRASVPAVNALDGLSLAEQERFIREQIGLHNDLLKQIEEAQKTKAKVVEPNKEVVPDEGTKK